mmetsp:Transcript_35600/g.82773  ORF Transcript_35600/g.82773 Transcript_35600/m.82773 type:complete len:198 (+) Transcript_35600:631-1224(+)
MWRQYFPRAHIACIDFYPDSAGVGEDLEGVSVHIANQGNASALRDVLESIPAPDIVIDDGSHLSRHIIVSYKVIYPRVKWNGLYVIEDLCATYREDLFGNGPARADGAVAFVKSLMDFVQMQAGSGVRPYHAWENDIKDIHFYGGGGVAVVHKGQWGAGDGLANGEYLTPRLNMWAHDARNRKWGQGDDQFLAWEHI